MPIRIISIPKPVSLIDYTTKKPLTENGNPVEWSFEVVLMRLMSNPMWQETFAGMRAQQSIINSWQNYENDEIQLAEDDWNKLKAAVENPRVTLTTKDGQYVAEGFGVHPTIAFQLVPLLQPIIDAKSR